MDGLAAMVERFRATGAAVFAVGDFNVNYRRDAVVQAKLFPYYRMKQVGAFASYKFLGAPDRGTHVNSTGINDTRLIDQVIAVGAPRHRADGADDPQRLQLRPPAASRPVRGRDDPGRPDRRGRRAVGAIGEGRWSPAAGTDRP